MHSRLAVLSNHTENSDQEITYINISIHAIRIADVPVCTLAEDIRTAMSNDAGLQVLQRHIIRRWLENKDELELFEGGTGQEGMICP